MLCAVFARHGESVCSAAEVMNGDRGVPCPLTEAGHRQALELGAKLEREPLDLCVTTGFERTFETASDALGSRTLEMIVIAELGDPGYGIYEGRSLAEYHAWAAQADSRTPPPGGGESRVELVARYARGLERVLAQPEERMLVVAHSLPIAYLASAAAGDSPRRSMPMIPYATPIPFTAGELAHALEVLERWIDAPGW